MNDEQTRTRFETLLLPLMKDAYNLSRWLMKNQEDAEDMVQESYLRHIAFLAPSTREQTAVPGSCASCETHATPRWAIDASLSGVQSAASSESLTKGDADLVRLGARAPDRRKAIRAF
jgi:hypothetical protein